MKRKVWTALVCAMLCLAFMGVSMAATLSPAGEFPIVDEPVEITVLTAPYSMTEDMVTNSLSLWLEKLTNVKVNWIVVNQADAAQKINLILASGSDMPEVFMVPNSYLSLQQIVTYGEQGYFLPLNDLIDEWGVNTKAFFEARPGVQKSCTAPDGNLYFLPKYNECYHCLFPNKAYINQTWLDNLGLAMPETTDDLIEVLKAFRDKDANGNGDIADEVPLVGTLMGYLTDPFMQTSTNNNLLVNDGIVSLDYMSDEYKDALKFLKKLYDEKLIPEDIFMLNRDQIRVLTGNADTNRVGMFISGIVTDYIDISTGLQEQFVAANVLTGPSGRKATSKAGVYFEPTFIITSSCKNPEAAFRWGDVQMADLLSDDLKWVNLKYGPIEEDNTWRYAEEGEIAVNGEPAKWAWTFDWGAILNTHWYEMGPGFFSQEFKTAIVTDRSQWNHEAVLYDASRDIYEPCVEDVSMPVMLMMNSELAETIASLQTTLGTYAEQSRVKFVTGAWDIDADWDNYIGELENIGVTEYLDAWQQVYDVIYAVK
jgi:putative aldouronate transport system substrate-binding protein